MAIKLSVAGAAGRMGGLILDLALKDNRFEVVSALEQASHPAADKPLKDVLPSAPGSIPVLSDVRKALSNAKVLIDFTLPQATREHLKAARETGTALVIGTTGIDGKGKEAIAEAAREIPVVFSPNMSVGMNLLFVLVEEAARKLGMAYDVEIVEAHHKMKKDAPSGSALRLGESVAKAWGRDLKAISVHGREGLTGERQQGIIGFHAVRGGDIVGDHTVYLAGPGERLELKHQAHTREAFARGSLMAALYLGSAKPGLYTMQDVLK